jgi:hypothetical protein
MLPLRCFQQSYRDAVQPREEKTTGLTAADWIRMCRATYSSGLGATEVIPRNEREERGADRWARRLVKNR